MTITKLTAAAPCKKAFFAVRIAYHERFNISKSLLAEKSWNLEVKNLTGLKD